METGFNESVVNHVVITNDYLERFVAEINPETAEDASSKLRSQLVKNISAYCDCE